MAFDTEVGICNAALTRAGITSLLSSLTETTPNAVICNERYPDVRDAALRNHPWKFATTFDSLSADVAAPAWKWAYSYTLPGDCLRLLALQSPGIPYERVAGGKLYTDYGAPLNIKYIARVTDVSLMDELFKSAVAFQLAAELCMAITKDLERANMLHRAYEKSIADARFIDSAERSAQPLRATEFLDARLAGAEVVNTHGDA